MSFFFEHNFPFVHMSVCLSLFHQVSPFHFYVCLFFMCVYFFLFFDWLYISVLQSCLFHFHMSVLCSRFICLFFLVQMSVHLLSVCLFIFLRLLVCFSLFYKVLYFAYICPSLNVLLHALYKCLFVYPSLCLFIKVFVMEHNLFVWKNTLIHFVVVIIQNW
jgi:hypothetical protein